LKRDFSTEGGYLKRRREGREFLRAPCPPPLTG